MFKTEFFMQESYFSVSLCTYLNHQFFYQKLNFRIHQIRLKQGKEIITNPLGTYLIVNKEL
jgi:hypothetical protein